MGCETGEPESSTAIGGVRWIVRIPLAYLRHAPLDRGWNPSYQG